VSHGQIADLRHHTPEMPLRTQRDWEQSLSFPDSAAKTLLRVIEQDPERVLNALARTVLPPVPASPDSRS
jgi:DNA-binding transcriptional regulator YiaG